MIDASGEEDSRPWQGSLSGSDPYYTRLLMNQYTVVNSMLAFLSVMATTILLVCGSGFMSVRDQWRISLAPAACQHIGLSIHGNSMDP